MLLRKKLTYVFTPRPSLNTAGKPMNFEFKMSER